MKEIVICLVLSNGTKYGFISREILDKFIVQQDLKEGDYKIELPHHMIYEMDSEGNVIKKTMVISPDKVPD